MGKIKFLTAIIGCLLFQLLTTGAGAALFPAKSPSSKAEEAKLKDAGPGTDAEKEFAAARSEFEAGRYEGALELLDKLITQPSLAESIHNDALRLSGDCNYFLGLKGSPRLLLAAVEKYKMFLRLQPDPAVGNDLAYYRMSQTYEKLNFYYEAASALDKLVSLYPDSPFSPEAIFKQAGVYMQTGKYDRAIERLTAYLKKNPAGPDAKRAAFTIGDCYYRLRKYESADKSYEEARKRWPDIQYLAPAILMNMGNNYFALGKFDVSQQLFSLFANLFPSDDFAKRALYMMARTAEAGGDKVLALKLYRHFSEKYPGGSEADDGALAMARLGVARPGIKFPDYIMAIDDYRAPLLTCDRLLAKSAEGEKAAAVMLLKGEVLISYGRLKEGFDLCLAGLAQFPRGKTSEEGRKKLRLLVPSLVDNYYQKNDYPAVTNIYFQGGGKGFSLVDDFDSGVKIAESLRATGFYDEAAEVYEVLKEIARDREKESRITFALAKIDIAKDRSAAAEAKLQALLKTGGSKEQALRKAAKLALADLYYKKGLYAKANLLYADVLSAGGEGLGAAYRNFGRSLQALHLTEQAVANYLRLLKDHEQHPGHYPADIIADIYIGLGDACYETRKYAQGIAAYGQALSYLTEKNISSWLNYRIGKGYMLLQDFNKAEKSFISVEEKAADEFWPKVTDYAREDARRHGQAGKQK